MLREYQARTLRHIQGTTMRDRPMTLAERKAIRQRDREARFGIPPTHLNIPNAHRLMKAEVRAWARSGL